MLTNLNLTIRSVVYQKFLKLFRSRPLGRLSLILAPHLTSNQT